MERDGADVSVCTAAPHTCTQNSADSWYHRIMIYFLVSCFCKPDTESHLQGQNVEPRQCRTNEDSALSQCNTRECASRCGNKRGHKTHVENLPICHEANEGTENSQGLGYNISAGAACRGGYDFGFKHGASNAEANINAADKQGGKTGLNLHFILIILFSTNKLTPEKT